MKVRFAKLWQSALTRLLGLFVNTEHVPFKENVRPRIIKKNLQMKEPITCQSARGLSNTTHHLKIVSAPLSKKYRGSFFTDILYYIVTNFAFYK